MRFAITIYAAASGECVDDELSSPPSRRRLRKLVTPIEPHQTFEELWQQVKRRCITSSGTSCLPLDHEFAKFTDSLDADIFSQDTIETLFDKDAPPEQLSINCILCPVVQSSSLGQISMTKSSDLCTPSVARCGRTAANISHHSGSSTCVATPRGDDRHSRLAASEVSTSPRTDTVAMSARRFGKLPLHRVTPDIVQHTDAIITNKKQQVMSTPNRIAENCPLPSKQRIGMVHINVVRPSASAVTASGIVASSSTAATKAQQLSRITGYFPFSSFQTTDHQQTPVRSLSSAQQGSQASGERVANTSRYQSSTPLPVLSGSNMNDHEPTSAQRPRCLDVMSSSVTHPYEDAFDPIIDASSNAPEDEFNDGVDDALLDSVYTQSQVSQTLQTPARQTVLEENQVRHNRESALRRDDSQDVLPEPSTKKRRYGAHPLDWQPGEIDILMANRHLSSRKLMAFLPGRSDSSIRNQLSRRKNLHVALISTNTRQSGCASNAVPSTIGHGTAPVQNPSGYGTQSRVLSTDIDVPSVVDPRDKIVEIPDSAPCPPVAEPSPVVTTAPQPPMAREVYLRYEATARGYLQQHSKSRRTLSQCIEDLVYTDKIFEALRDGNEEEHRRLQHTRRQTHQERRIARRLNREASTSSTAPQTGLERLRRSDGSPSRANEMFDEDMSTASEDSDASAEDDNCMEDDEFPLHLHDSGEFIRVGETPTDLPPRIIEIVDDEDDVADHLQPYENATGTRSSDVSSNRTKLPELSADTDLATTSLSMDVPSRICELSTAKDRPICRLVSSAGEHSLVNVSQSDQGLSEVRNKNSKRANRRRRRRRSKSVVQATNGEESHKEAIADKTDMVHRTPFNATRISKPSPQLYLAVPGMTTESYSPTSHASRPGEDRSPSLSVSTFQHSPSARSSRSPAASAFPSPATTVQTVTSPRTPTTVTDWAARSKASLPKGKMNVFSFFPDLALDPSMTEEKFKSMAVPYNVPTPPQRSPARPVKRRHKFGALKQLVTRGDSSSDESDSDSDASDASTNVPPEKKQRIARIC